MLKTLLFLLSKLSRSKNIPEKIKPTSTRVISMGALYQILRKRFPEGELYLSDSMYLLSNKADISKFLQQDATNKYKYQSEKYDCDDFAVRLWGQFTIPLWSHLAFGMVWTNLHALNILVTEDLEVLFVEPQSDTLQKELKPWQGSQIRFVCM